jgi:hypothetical protein
MEVPKKTLFDDLYEETEIKSNTMTKEEFEQIPLNDLYIANQKKKLVLEKKDKCNECYVNIKSDTN